MHVDIACMVCAIDPGTANLLLPIAQATIISAPILFREQIRRGIRVVRDRRGGEQALKQNRIDDPTDASETPDQEPTHR